jgi:hypothetical protein
MSGLLAVLGGGNRRQFHSFRNLLVLNTTNMTWSRPQARGARPRSVSWMFGGGTVCVVKEGSLASPIRSA